MKLSKNQQFPAIVQSDVYLLGGYQKLEFVQHVAGMKLEGTTNEELIQVLVHRLGEQQKGASSRETALAITKLEEALMWLDKREAQKVEERQVNLSGAFAGFREIPGDSPLGRSLHTAIAQGLKDGSLSNAVGKAFAHCGPVTERAANTDQVAKAA